MVLLEGSAPGPGREVRTPGTGSHLAGGRDRLKRVGGWDRRDDLRVVPRLRDLVLALDLGQVDVVDDSVVGADLTVAQEDVVDLLAVELLDHGVGVIRAGALDCLEVVHRGGVVARVGEGGTGAGLGQELVSPRLVLGIQVPVPRVREAGAGELIDPQRVDVGDEHQADGQLRLALHARLVVLLDEVDQVTASGHDPDDLRGGRPRLGDERGEVVIGEGRRNALLYRAASPRDRGGERLLHVLAERVVGVDDAPALAAVLDNGFAGALGEHGGVVGPGVGVLVAGPPGQRGRAGGDVDEELLPCLGDGGDGERGGGGRDVQDDVGVLPVVHLLRLGVGDVGFVLVVRRDDLDGLGNRLGPVFGLVVVDRHLDRNLAVRAGQVLVDTGLLNDQSGVYK